MAGWTAGQSDLIIFDCDGVLVDSELLSCQCLSDELSVSGISLTLAQALDCFSAEARARSTQHYRVLGQTLPVDLPLAAEIARSSAFDEGAPSGSRMSRPSCLDLRMPFLRGLVERSRSRRALP